MQQVQSLECQRQVFRCSEDGAASTWSTAVQKLPPQLLKFSLNAVQDTLPHNANLVVWRRREGLSSACKLCGKRQTLLHFLNNCPEALNMLHYNERHDADLKSSPSSRPRAYQTDTNSWQTFQNSSPTFFPPTLPQLTSV